MTKTELIQKFIDNDCSADEARIVMQYLRDEPNLLDEFLKKKEWDEIDGASPLGNELEAAIKSEVKRQTSSKPANRMVRIMLAAASVAAIVLFAYSIVNETKVEMKPAGASGTSTLPRIEKLNNTTTKSKTFNLPDHSVVTLYPGSSVEFEAGFNTNRNIQLSGKAIFDVTKDEEHPFTVLSGGISTTALGTRFMVDNSSGTNSLNVKLYEGRVVVRPVDASVEIKETVLNAGEQCFINIGQNKILVDLLFDRKAVVKLKLPKPAIPQKILVAEPVRLDFVQTPLVTVFGELEKMFGRKIVYDSAFVSLSNFTGSFSSTDSISTILKLIARMNRLHFTEGDHGFELTKKQPGDNIVSSIGDTDSGSFSNIAKGTLLQKTPVTLLREAVPMVLPPPVQIKETQEGVHFYNTPLAFVIKKLEEFSGFTIAYNNADILGLSFSGQIKKDASAIRMLQVICRMNGLSLTKEGTSYIITK